MVVTSKSSGKTAFNVNLMTRELSIVHNPESRTLQLFTKNADFMRIVKKYFHKKMALNAQGVNVSADAMKEYSVSGVFVNIISLLYSDDSSFSYLNLFQNVNNLLSAVNCVSETEKNGIILLLAKARKWNILKSND